MSKVSKKPLSYWISSVFFTLAQRLSVMLVGIGAFLILVRVLSKTEMGIYALFFTIITIFEVTRDGLIKNALIRFINISPKEDNSRIQSTALVLSLIYTLLFVALIFIGAKPLSIYWETPQLAKMLYVYAVTAIVSIFFSHAEYIQQANLYFKGIFLIYFVKQGFYFLFIVLFVFIFKDPSLYKLVLLQSVAVAVATVVGVISARKFFLKKFEFSTRWIADQWKYGRFVLATNVSSQALRTIDHFLLASLVSTQAVALYNTSVRISNLLDMPSKAVAEALFPKSVQKSTNGNKEVAKLYEQTTGGILAVLIPMCLFILIFPDLIIRIIAGAKYLDAVPVLRIAVIYSLLLPFQKQFGTVMDASGKPKINFIVNLLLALFNLIIVYFSVKAFGLLGAAYGLLITLIIALIITQIILKREFGVSTISVFKQVGVFYSYLFKKNLMKQVLSKETK
ncbi:flippase [Flexithrix dorotheae]|uniref:flippase n=1 Tax=Flexithrix dorotheae TaxID=70993 RepID=UPI0003A61D79|nr:flippase [Flexithrix dorotheae]